MSLTFKITLGLFLLGFLTYAQTLDYPFVHDDLVFIVQNPHIAQWADFKGIFSPALSRASAAGTNQYYRPLIELSYRIQYLLFQDNPQGYHFFNIILHILNSLFVYRIGHILTKRQGLALATAVVFLVHPVQTEAVASIAGISNLLFALLCLMSFDFYLRGHYPISWLSFAGSLLAKEQAIFFIGVLFLYEGLFSKHSLPEGVIKVQKPRYRWIVFIVITAAYLILRKITLGQTIMSFLSYPQELMLRILAIPQALLMYLKILFVPLGLHYYRSIDILQPSLGPSIFLLVLIISVTFLISRSSNPRMIILGFGWFLITLLPLQILPLITEYSFVMAAEHFLYFPLCGFLLAFFILLDEKGSHILKKFSSKMFLIVSATIVAVLVLMSRQQSSYWRGEIPLFQRALQFQNHLGRVHILLARAYYFSQKIEQAIEHYQIALDIMQEYVAKTNLAVAKSFYLGYIKEIHFDLAHCYEARGQWGRAVFHYQEAIQVSPQDGLLYNNAGAALVRMGKLEEASEYFTKALELDSQDVMAMSNLAICYIQKGDFQKAKALLEKALRVDPGFGLAQENLKRLLEETEHPPTGGLMIK